MSIKDYKTTRIRQLKRFILIGAASLILILFGTFIGLRIWIAGEANSIARDAAKVFHSNKTKALIALIESEDYSLKEKNNAIWALGVLKDKQALPTLESMVTGLKCNHDSEICQYEINKAILKIKGEFRGSWQASNNKSANSN